MFSRNKFPKELKEVTKALKFWKWMKRFKCHRRFWVPCQYTDHPMDNRY